MRSGSPLPLLSELLVLIQIALSPGTLTTARSRPNWPLKCEVTEVTFSPLITIRHSRWPRRAAMNSAPLAKARPLGDASATDQVRFGLVMPETSQLPSHV